MTEETRKAAEKALSAKRCVFPSIQLEGEALELFLSKKPFELQKIIEGEEPEGNHILEL